MKAGVLALQGDFREHLDLLGSLGAATIEVRTPAHLEEVGGLVIPGGESTAITRLAHARGLVEPLRERIGAGMPVFGTCAGLILLAREVAGGEPLLGAIDIRVTRNAYGRQTDSFEADVEVGDVGPVRGVFIRAPVIERVGRGVRVLAEHEGRPVVVEEDAMLAASFHPELVGDDGLHRRFLERMS